ncbi:peptidase M15 [Arcobacter sp. CECT 8983]|uniref:M15 family metallopeptidase n=1 Tax=Arcobacter sp. CECT 8983 TaxID=2044508 RepID=UPI00100B9F09|nr:M15 family metallopeptidase [Arcobacter sp. CECT 8983]RXJ89534.1 peptidase M15 [Arcobacter sp. CECT 8983]
MKRRDFLKSTALASLFGTSNLFAKTDTFDSSFEKIINNIFGNKDSELEEIDRNKDEYVLSEEEYIGEVKDSLQINTKDTNNSSIARKNKTIIEDVFIEEKFLKEFQSVRKKINLVQRHVGYGNFNIIDFDYMLKVARHSSKMDEFTKKELDFLESIFYYDPSIHGFYGKRISQNITDSINKKDVRKIPYTGHYLFKGHPEETYYQMIDDIGESLTLTSGVRSIVKQTKLFLDKVHSVDGNLTDASKSLAPPAYTYHSIADFDVGKKGFGKANFSSRFALTDEFFKMRKLKYIDMRYTVNNKDGVRYEPWHVKII